MFKEKKQEEKVETFTTEECKKMLLDGKKMRSVEWIESSDHVYFDFNGMEVLTGCGDVFNFIIDWDKWQIYEDPKEKIGEDLVGMVCFVWEDGDCIDYNLCEIVKGYDKENDLYLTKGGINWSNAKPVPKETLEKWMEFYNEPK